MWAHARFYRKRADVKLRNSIMFLEFSVLELCTWTFCSPSATGSDVVAQNTLLGGASRSRKAQV